MSSDDLEKMWKRNKAQRDHERREAYKAKGICPNCKVARPEPGRVLCPACAEKQRKVSADVYAKRKSEGQMVPDGWHKVGEYNVLAKNDQAISMKHMDIEVKPYHFDAKQGGFTNAIPCNFRTLQLWIRHNELKFDYIVEGNE